MAHGIKPYGRTQAQQTIYGVQDMGEMAARVANYFSLDRLGNLLWADDFEDGIERWETGGALAGNSVDWSSEKSYRGAFSAKLTCGMGATGSAVMDRRQAYKNIGRLGFEFWLQQDNHVTRFEKEIILYDGTNRWEYAIDHTYASGRFRYRNSLGAWVNITPIKMLFPYSTLFHGIKLVIDIETHEYIRLLVNNTVFDLSGLGAYQVGDATNENILHRITVIGRAAVNAVAYLDNYRITENEP